MQVVDRRPVLCAALLCLAAASRAQAPRTLSYQGRVANAVGAALPDGSRSVTFRFYDGPAGQLAVSGEARTFSGGTVTLGHTQVVSNSETVRSTPGNVLFTRGADYTVDYPTGVITRVSAATIPDGTAVRVSYGYTAAMVWEETKTVPVKGGLITTALGDTTALPASAVLGSTPLYLGIRVGTDAGMQPRAALMGAPYALGVALPYADRVTVDSPGSAFSIANAGTGAAFYGRTGPGSGISGAGSAVWADSDGTAVMGTSSAGSGVVGASVSGNGVYGISTTGPGVLGITSDYGSGFHYASVQGVSSPNVGVGVYAGNLFPFGVAGFQTNFSGATTHIWCAEQGARVFGVTAGGAVSGLSWTELSDARFKRHIEPLANPLASVLRLHGVSFEWNPRSAARSFPSGTQIGFVAQAVEKVLPEVVHTDPDGSKSVAYQNIVPVLVEAMRQQQRQIAAQQGQIGVLRAAADRARARMARLDAMEARLRRLERSSSGGHR